MRLPKLRSPRFITRFTNSAIRERLNISRLAIQHSGLTIFCWIAIAVAGLFAFSSLKYALFPDITFPVVVVNATAPTATALESESQLTNPIEQQLQALDGLNEMVSSTFAGRSVTNLRFKVGTNLAETTAAVEANIAAADLPASADVEVVPLNLNEETAVSYAITSDRLSTDELAALSEREILPALRSVEGVLRVDLLGTGIAANALDVSSEPSENFLADLRNSPTLVRFDGEDALAFQVVKRGDANTLEVVSRLEAEVQQIRADFPDVALSMAASQADFIRASTRATIDSLIGAVAIAVLVIFGFLKSWRATLITALAIPLSLLGTCIVMAVYGFNLETITLLALALVIGIIVDDAIVEIENIIRHIELGQSPRQAALIATDEIGLTVSASTLTIVAVFLPVAFMGGTIGQFFKPFGLTISASVLVSLLVARTLTPVLAVYWLKPKQYGNGAIAPESHVNEESLEETAPVSWLEQGYSRLLSWSLAYRWAVVGIAIASFIAGVAIIPLIPQGFIPQLDRGEFYLNYTVPLPQVPQNVSQGTFLEQQQNQQNFSQSPVDPRVRLLQQSFATGGTLEETVLTLPDVESVLTTVGGQGRPNQGSLYIKLRSDRMLDTATVQSQLRQKLPPQSEVTTSVEDVQFIDTGGEKPLQISLLSDNLATLNQAAADVKSQIEDLPGFADVRVSTEENTAETTTEINHRNGQRAVFISANLAKGEALGDATDQVVAVAESVVPPDVRISLGGDSARIGEVLGSFARTLVLAVFCMLAVLFLPFGRLLEPAVVGLSLPLSIVGSMLALLVTRSDFGMVSLLGLLFLLGLLDKNALLLMDYTNQLRRAGMARTAAIVKTGLVRLRPILMTTASTVLGMLPIAFGLGAGSELRQPLAVAIIGGLLTSTLLSLVVVPVLYSLLEDGWARITRQRKRA